MEFKHTALTFGISQLLLLFVWRILKEDTENFIDGHPRIREKYKLWN